MLQGEKQRLVLAQEAAAKAVQDAKEAQSTASAERKRSASKPSDVFLLLKLYIVTIHAYHDSVAALPSECSVWSLWQRCTEFASDAAAQFASLCLGVAGSAGKASV